MTANMVALATLTSGSVGSLTNAYDTLGAEATRRNPLPAHIHGLAGMERRSRKDAP